MRSSTALLCAMAVTACNGTEGDLLRSKQGPQTEADSGVARPRPAPLSSWQIQLSGTLDASLDVKVYTVDLETPVAVIDGFHAAGRIALCYFSAGTREPFRADAGLFPANTLGAPLLDYPEERWVDVRDPTVRSIMRVRLEKAAALGCDGVHPSGLAAFLSNTELDFARAEQVAYNRFLASTAHGLGLSIGLVEGNESLAQEHVQDFDWTVVWSCVASGCEAAVPFVSAGKAAFLIEYGDERRLAEVCASARSRGLSAIIKRDSNLDAFRVGCP